MKKEKKEKKEQVTLCEKCAYYVWDEEEECYLCDVTMDEDDFMRLIESSYKHCPYYVSGDSYELARKQ